MQSRRDEVIELLLVGSAAKLEVGMLVEAGRLLERALRLAQLPEPLPGPWAALAAYRLALVELRRPLEPHQLERVIELLDQAASSDLLGPWPALYRLAALSRLGADREVLAVDARRVQALAQAAARGSADRAWGLLGATAGGRAEAMVEFFGLSLGLEIEPETSRRPLVGAYHPYDWQLVGSAIGPHPRSLPRQLAIAEFEAYQAREGASEQLFFVLPAQGTAWMSVAGGEPEPSHPQGLRVLATLLTDPPMPSHELRDRVLGPDASDVAWDKARSRLGKRLRAMLGEGGPGPIAQDDQGRFVLMPELRILGLVEQEALEPTIRRRGSRFESDEPVGYRRSV